MSELNKLIDSVPSSKPPTGPCVQCGGSGKHRVVGMRKCGYCWGLGRDPQSNLLHKLCKNCQGSGEEFYSKMETCPRCWGSGKG